MSNHLFRCACAAIDGKLGDVQFNTDCIINTINTCTAQKVDILTFPEMCLTGYSCGDILFNQCMLEQVHSGLERIAKSTEGQSIFAVVGAPLKDGEQILNCAVVLHNGTVLGVVPKLQLDNTHSSAFSWSIGPEGNEEKEICLSGQRVKCSPWLLFEDAGHGLKIGVVLGKDMENTISAGNLLSRYGANLIINPSAERETVASYEYVSDLTKMASLQNKCAYLYASSGEMESTTDQVFGSYFGIFENGKCITQTKPLETAFCICGTVDLEHIHQVRVKRNTQLLFLCGMRDREAITVSIHLPAAGEHKTVSQEPFLEGMPVDTVCRRVIELQGKALLNKIKYTRRNKLIIGVSGGLDSTIALLACCHAFRKAELPLKNIIGVTMPGPGTTERTYRNALKLMEQLGVTSMEIDITAAVSAHLKNIKHPKALFDITYEQTQSRERTKVLMDLANQQEGIVIGTGDLSELALGWMSYSGDQISMYGINSGIPKTVMRHLGQFCVEHTDGELSCVLKDIVDTPVSPELLPVENDGTQKQETEALVGPYIVHDFFLYYLVKYGYSPEKVLDLANCAFRGIYDSVQLKTWMRVFLTRFFTRQFKRTCFPDGCQVFDVSLSPRNGWRMPSDVYADVFLGILE